MKVLIINHCAHNKGDNSVLYFLSKKLNLQQKIKEIYLSSSDGKVPFWGKKNLFKKTCYWGQGKTFLEKNPKFIDIYFLKFKNFFYKRIIFKVIIFLFGINKDYLNKIIINFFYDKNYLKVLLSSDLVISTGGHHISPELDKNSICVQLTDMISSLIFSKKIIFWSQSIGTINYECKYVIRAVRRLIKESEYTFPRDKNSISFIRKIKAYNSKKIIKCPDSVFGLQKNSTVKIKRKKVALIAIYTAKKRNFKEENEYIDFFSKILIFLAKKKFKISLLPMQYKGLSGDERNVLKKILVKSKVKTAKIIDKDKSPKDTIKLFNSSNLIISHKTHAIFYGLSLSIPTLAIFYHKKIKDIMETYKLKKFAINDKTLDFNKTKKLINELITNESIIKKKIFRKSVKISKVVNDNFYKFIKKIYNI